MIAGLIDPIKGKSIDSDDLLCTGWIDENEKIDEIKIFLDNFFLGNASFENKMGEINNYFFFYKHISMDNGNHVLDVKFYKNHAVCGELEPQDFIVNKSLASIQLVNVQLTNRCNLKCRWCSVSQFEKKEDMNIVLFKKLMHQINSPHIQINEIMLQTAGESLLHPDLKHFLNFLGQLKKRPKTTLVTNATCLTNELSNIILSSHGLDSLQFSVDGGTKESYEWLRRGAVYERTIENILEFLKINSGQIHTGIISINLGMAFDEKFNDLCKKVNSVEIRAPHNWTGYEILEDFKISQDYNPFPCSFIKNNLVIRLNGDVAVCCADQIGRGIIGNIEKDHIYDLWKTKRYEIFKLHAQGRKNTLPLCEKCSIMS